MESLLTTISLAGMRAFVGGATSGIGEATARELASLGCAVIVGARDPEKIAGVVDALPDENLPDDMAHSGVAVDFADPEAIAGVAAGLVEEGPVHILINNTGGPPPGRAIDASESAYIDAFRMHLGANLALAQAFTPGMIEAGYGRIVNVISTSVRQPIPNLGVSNTIRGAVASWAKTISAELAPHGITVNNILPGFTDTPRLRSLISSRAGKQGATEDEVRREMIGSIPAGRLGEPEEIARVIAFCCTPAASYLNGQSVCVDGGRTGTL